VVTVYRARKSAVAPRPHGAVSGYRVLLALLLTTVFLCAVAAIVIAASMGHQTAALVIALVAGGSFSAALA
jgi:hypothetical protein